jgi:hypothetical protein
VKTDFQHRFFAIVWWGIIDDQVTGPVLLEHRLTEQTYLEFLQSTLPRLLEDVPLAHRLVCTISMTELLHISRVVIQYLNNTPLVNGSAMVV